MTSSEDTQIRHILQATPEIRLPAWGSIVAEADRRRVRATRAAAFSACVAVVLIGVLAMIASRHEGTDTVVARPPDVDAEVADPSSTLVTPPLNPRWDAFNFLPPLTSNQGEATTLSAAGYVLAISDQGVALFDTTTRASIDLSSFPVRSSEDTEIGWAGDRFVAFTDERTTQGVTNSVYAINPADGSWTALDRPAGLQANPTFAVWTGSSLVIGGSTGTASDRVSSYDPDTQTWAELPDLPTPVTQARATWTGTEIVIVAADVTATTSGELIAVTGQADDTPWLSLPRPDISERAFTVASTDDGVHLLDYELRHVVLRDGRWVDAPSPAPVIQPAECVPHARSANGILWFDYCGALVALPTGGQWQTIAPAALDIRSQFDLVDDAQPPGDALFVLIGNQLHRLAGP